MKITTRMLLNSKLMSLTGTVVPIPMIAFQSTV